MSNINFRWIQIYIIKYTNIYRWIQIYNSSFFEVVNSARIHVLANVYYWLFVSVLKTFLHNIDKNYEALFYGKSCFSPRHFFCLWTTSYRKPQKYQSSSNHFYNMLKNILLVPLRKPPKSHFHLYNITGKQTYRSMNI